MEMETIASSGTMRPRRKLSERAIGSGNRPITKCTLSMVGAPHARATLMGCVNVPLLRCTTSSTGHYWLPDLPAEPCKNVIVIQSGQSEVVRSQCTTTTTTTKTIIQGCFRLNKASIGWLVPSINRVRLCVWIACGEAELIGRSLLLLDFLRKESVFAICEH